MHSTRGARDTILETIDLSLTYTPLALGVENLLSIERIEKASHQLTNYLQSVASVL